MAAVPVPGTTSGTISQTVFNTDKLVASALRRCRIPAPKITGEMQIIAQQQLFLKLSELAAQDIPLWAIDTQILPLYQGTNQVLCPLGTVDVLNLNLRTLQILTGVATSTSGTAANAFSQNFANACTQTSPNGSITLTFPAASNLSNFGLLPNATGAWNYQINTSPDGVTWTTIYTQINQAVTAGVWFWWDIDNVTNTKAIAPLNGVIAVQIVATGGTTLNVTELVFANTPQEVPMAIMNRDIWRNLNNRDFQGRPTQYYYDKQFQQPILRIWPAADAASSFRQLTLTRHRYIQDVGSLTQIVEIPQRWYNAIVDLTAFMCAREIPEVAPELIPQLENWAGGSLKTAWSSETDRSPSFLSPDLSCYTK